MRDFSEDLKALAVRLDEARAYLKIDAGRGRLSELEQAVQDPALWDDQDRARAVNSELSQLRGDVDTYDLLARRLEDTEVLAELARDESDESQEPEIQHSIHDLDRRLAELELRSLFVGEHDE